MHFTRKEPLLLCGIVIALLLPQTSRSKNTPVATFGVLSDNRISSKVVKDALREAWQELQDSVIVDELRTAIRMDSGFELIDPTNPTEVLQKVCRMLTSSPLFVMFVTKCNDDPGLNYLSEAMRLPVLQVAMAPPSECRNTYANRNEKLSEKWATFFTDTDRPAPPTRTIINSRYKEVHAEYGDVTPSRPIASRLGTSNSRQNVLYWDETDQNLVGKYLASLEWDRLYTFYDSGFDFGSLQNVIENFGERMQFTTAQRLPSKYDDEDVVDVKASKKMIDKTMKNAEQRCPRSRKASRSEKVISVFFCREETTKDILIDLLTHHVQKENTHIYLVDIGWKTNFLHGVLFSRSFSIITKYRSRSTYEQNYERLKTQLMNTLDAVTAVLRRNSSFVESGSNIACGTTKIYPDNVSKYFVSAIRDELKRSYVSVDDDMSNMTANSDSGSIDKYGADGEQEALDAAASAFLNLPLQSSNSYESEMKVCAMSRSGQVACQNIVEAMNEEISAKKNSAFKEFLTSPTSITPELHSETNAHAHVHQAYNPYEILNNRTFRVATIRDPPFVFIEYKEDRPIFSGYSIDLLDRLAHIGKFEYELYEVHDRKYGSYRNGTWNGLVADLIAKRADLVISAMTVTPQREQYIDFTTRYMDYAVGILMKKSEPSTTTFAFLRPFNGTVWYCIIGGLFTVSLLLYVLNRVSPVPDGVKEYNDRSLHGTFWFVYSTLVQQGAGMCLSSISSQIVTGVWWFFVLIIVSSYTANLAAHLTVSRLETKIKSFPDLSMQSQVKYGTVQDTSIYDYLQIRGNQAVDDSSMWSRLWEMTNSHSLSFVEQGIRKVKESEGSYAFLWDVAVIEFLVLTDPFCSLATVQDFIFEKGYGIGVQQGDPIKDALSLGILELEDRGELSRMKSRWWKPNGCNPADQRARYSSQLNLESFAGVFCILAGGLVVASLVALCEICSKAKAHRRMKMFKQPVGQDGNENVIEETELLQKKTSTHPQVSFLHTDKDEIHIVIAGAAREKSQITRNSGEVSCGSAHSRTSVTGISSGSSSSSKVTQNSSRDEGVRSANGHALPLINGTLHRVHNSNRK